MSQHQINHLGDLVKQILNVLQKFQEQIISALNNLKELPELVKKILHSVSESANRQIKAVGEIEIIKKTANLDAKRHQISSENEAINDFKRQLREDIDYIKEKYDNLDQELNEEAKKRVRELDSNLLGIPDFFPQDFIDGYITKIYPLMEELRKEFNAANKQRTDFINQKMLDVIYAITGFLDSRRSFFNKIEEFKYDDIISKTEKYWLPFLFLETNNIQNYFLPGVVSLSKYINSNNANYKPHAELKSFHESISKNADINRKMIDHIQWQKTNKEEFENSLISFADNFFYSDKKLIKKAVKEIIKSSEIYTVKK